MRTPRQTRGRLRPSKRTRNSIKQFVARESGQLFHTLLQCESLEGRSLLSATATPEVEIESSASTTVSGLTAKEVSAAYGFSSVSETGAGQTIAIVDAYNDPNIKSDLATFDSKMGLAAANLTVVNQSGGTSLPQTDSGWDLEIALDVEWAHAIAPGANILLVEANSDNLTDLLSAVHYATTVSSVSVVSMSWGSSEFSGETSYDSYFTTPAGHQGITFVGASGDDGSPGIWPSISSNVLAVGGTTLNVSSSGTYLSETAWSDSGGGTSLYESEPSWQESVQTTGKRTSPDVSYDANPNTGFAVYDSVATDGQSGWFEVGGTSDAAPQWAALLADANQGRVAAGESTLAGAQAAIYSLPSADFHDITSGSNGGYSAKAGYDEVTGRGSPVANLVINGLISYSSSSSSSGSGSSGSGSTGTGSSGTGSSGSGSSGSGSSGSGSGSGSGGGSSSGYGGGHNPFGGWGGFGGYGGYGGFYGYGGRFDEIASSSTSTAEAVSDAVAAFEAASSGASVQVAASANPLVAIQATSAPAGGSTTETTSAGSLGQATESTPVRLTAFATLENEDLSDFAPVSPNAVATDMRGVDDASLEGNRGGETIASESHARPTAASAIQPNGDAAAAASVAAWSDRSFDARVAPEARPATPGDEAAVEWSPAMTAAVWSALDFELGDPAAIDSVAAASAGAAAPDDGSAGAYSPLAMVAAGVALSWVKDRIEGPQALPVRRWPDERVRAR